MHIKVWFLKIVVKRHRSALECNVFFFYMCLRVVFYNSPDEKQKRLRMQALSFTIPCYTYMRAGGGSTHSNRSIDIALHRVIFYALTYILHIPLTIHIFCLQYNN